MRSLIAPLVCLTALVGPMTLSGPAARASNCPGAAAYLAAGIADGFALPEEPVSPSSELRTFIEDVLVKPVRAFDDVGADRTFGHTFGGLPGGIQGAVLTMRIRAVSYGSANDTVNLEVPAGPGETWGWAIFLSDLQGSSWDPGAETVVVLDLGDLPPGNHGTTSILDLLVDGSLDVVVDDDTAVDSITLDLCLGAVGTRLTTWGALKAIHD